jgi:hypothetical protein
MVVNLEEKVDRIEDSLEHMENDSAQVIAGASLQRLEARLGQVESKLEKLLSVLEKMETSERLSVDSSSRVSR